MPSLRIIYDVEGWSYHHKTRALMRHAPADFEVSAVACRNSDGHRGINELLGDTPAELYLVMDFSLIPAFRAALTERNWHGKLLLLWSNGWPFRAWGFNRVYSFADHVIINNDGAWSGWGRLPRTSFIANGVDLDTFRVRRPLETRKQKVLWVGSEAHRHTKAYDDLLVPLQRELKRHGFQCELMLVDSYSDDKRSQEAMAEWYNHGTIYVCASRSEGTPNTALEAAACGCTVVSTPVGNMEQLIRDGANGRLVGWSLDSILEGVLDAGENYLSFAGAMQKDIVDWDWRMQAAAHYELFRNVLSDDVVPATAGKRDLSDQITVFATTVGAPTFDACMTRLKEQSCTYRLEVLDKIAPMSAAYQQMIERCRTPFYVQLDEDMLLHPRALEVLYDEMCRRGEDTAMVCACLYDCDLDRPLYGVKLIRHAIVSQYPFRNVEGTDVDQNTRMQSDGYRVELLRLEDTAASPRGVLGLHGVAYTEATGYERYAGLKRRYRRRPSADDWFSHAELALFKRFRDDPSRQNFFALMGAIAGTFWPLNGTGVEKDWRQYSQLPGFTELDTFYRRITSLDRQREDPIQDQD